jgi:ABC-type transport system involved in cytochrome c biogenesis permease subunit/tetratricopeptide (TPR) repeat protein
MSTTQHDDVAEIAAPKPRQLNGLDLLIKVLQPIASLKLTVSLFVMSMVLVFFGTLAQMDNGIWTVVDRYFWSLWVKVELKPFADFIRIFFFGIEIDMKGYWFPFPAGKTIGALMFVNLLAAHTIQLINLIRGVYKTAQKGKELNEVLLVLLKRSGIYILHGGLLLLFVGEYITREFQVEQQMRIAEGSSSSVAYDTRNHELAFVRPGSNQQDDVTVVPREMLLDALKNQKRISHESLPVDLEVLAYYTNSDLIRRSRNSEHKPEFEATSGIGLEYTAIPLPEVSGVDTGSNVDSPSVYVKLFKKGTDESLGVVLASTFSDSNLAAQPLPVPVTAINDVEYRITYRLKQYHKPYVMALKSFTYEKYVGTELAKNYASHVQLVDVANNVDRLATVSMNNPLRYQGETFYQHQFSQTPAGKVTTLQVVDNPGWKLPYVSCVMVTFGMLLHFVIALFTFLVRMLSTKKQPVSTPIDIPRLANPATASYRLARFGIPASIGLTTLLIWLMVLMPSSSSGTLQRIAMLPVVDGGRLKPLDTVVRTQLRIVSYRETYTDNSKRSQPAIKWYVESAMVNPSELGEIADVRIFRIENDQIRELLELQQREGLRYSLNEMRKGFERFDRAVENALTKDQKNRDLYDNKVLELSRHVKGYFDLCIGKAPLIVPPKGEAPWRAVSSVLTDGQEVAREAMLAKARAKGYPTDINQLTREQQIEMVGWLEDGLMEQIQKEALLPAWQELLSAYRSKDSKRLEKAIDSYEKALEGRVSPEELARVQFEAYLNQTAIYFWCTVLYIGIGLFLCMCSWLFLVISRPLAEGIRRGVFLMLLLTFFAHAFMMLSRMYLMDRPLVFVTNLYSSAVFIGLVAVMVCLVVELLFPLGIGNIVACVIGGVTSIIGHNLAMNGDTLEMMQAVLDTNLWLATHVTTVTFGYAATYVAGVVGLLYLGVSIFVHLLDKPLGARDSFGYQFQATLTVDRAFSHVMYGIICLAMLMSFLGTVLGGIWADQSWGRFWGWDPKENGAVLIVIWNAMILHARWAGLVKTRGIAILAIMGNMITTWSWFGTNQLSVGLHAYGFDKGLARLCVWVWISHIAVICSGLLWGLFYGKKSSPVLPKDQPTNA